jgi:N-acetylglucosamine kinase-like BadF-type ATPase
MSEPARPGRPRKGQVVVGIDAGGSSTRARAARGGVVVFEGAGGPGNPLAADDGVLLASYAAALAGCPDPGHIVACVSGTGSSDQRARICDLLTGMFPRTEVQVYPDYVAAVQAAPARTDVTVIAGTGSLVCSRLPDGTYAISGGRGWILGDHGSAARLGRAALEWFCEDPASAGQDFASAVEALLGAGDWRPIVSALARAASPAAYLARAAPLLTSAAERGAGWATARLDSEMSALAATTRRHADQHLTGRRDVRLALAGGVWSSAGAREAFAAALRREGLALQVAQLVPSPVDGAVRLAASMAP